MIMVIIYMLILAQSNQRCWVALADIKAHDYHKPSHAESSEV